MDRGQTITIHGALIGVAGSILTSIVMTIFRFWLARREEERIAREAHYRQLGHLHLPPDEDVIRINANRGGGEMPGDNRRPAGEGSLALSNFAGTLPV